jgi:hypothetical protein
MPAPTVSCRSFLVSLLLATVVGCSAGDSTAPSPPASAPLTGNLLVEVVPTLQGILVGVTITIEGAGIAVSQSSTTLRLNALAPGSYNIHVALIERSPARSSCSIQETNRRTASVRAGATTTVVFGVSCRAGPS